MSLDQCLGGLMIVFKPRLAAFYVVLFATIALLSNHMAKQHPSGVASNQSSTMGRE